MTSTETALARGGPVHPPMSLLRPLGTDEVRIAGGFWGQKQALNAEAIIAHCLHWMERIGWIANFDRVVDGTIGQARQGVEFVDSEVYKLLEALAWELGRRPDPELEQRYNDLVCRIAAAQDPDGYLHTAFGHQGQRGRYSDLEWGHELYCAGHLIQAAVARLRTGHDDLLVGVARRLADHVCREFGPDGRDAICGHPEIEPALAEFARATGEDRYRDMARLFIERRGRRTLKTTLFQGPEYFQDDVPVREAEVLRGHAVRALYLAAGAVDLASDTGDRELLSAVESQWQRTVSRRTHITGGMGSHHQNEEFGEDYELPPDRAYSETCAGIASVMLSWRLLLETGEAKYADLIERTLFNNILASPRIDGRAFYYANTLHQRAVGAELAQDELSERAEASTRAPWFEVSCCPTNIARTLAGIHSYFATADPHGIQLHQFGDIDIATATGAGHSVRLAMRTAYPAEGEIRITIEEDAEFTLSVRIPAWARGRTGADLDGESLAVEGDYLRVRRDFARGAVLRLRLPMDARLAWPSPRIDALRGTAAVERGPQVLCLESVDLPEGVPFEYIRLNPALPLATTPDGALAHLLIEAEPDSQSWPYGGQTRPIRAKEITARLVPYATWANRGPGKMRVWIPAGSAGQPEPAPAAASHCGT
ncbi:glycoside hydrolase family 127 protein [Sinomonas sp. JGH33]|uniref:Glycoside hydrolase family 127 protein n=1 Tax=Sinomonas terricola TaxID=3110330 RepID=A0ABU5TCH5_9MICC|nr:beta-L-arabinofuranosidase domain-containing protein [Sinomonas sp. JGH33]MEA5456771.1 glycoside hydrolase family 127 protein [Sinomonas sp. JGH33]